MSPTDLLLGRLAVQHGLASEAQVRECFADVQQAGGGSVADLLAQKGYLSPDGLRTLQRELARAQFVRAEQGLAKLCVERGLLTTDQARALLHQQAAEGYRWRLADRLVQQGVLDADTRDALADLLIERLDAEASGAPAPPPVSPPATPPVPPTPPRATGAHARATGAHARGTGAHARGTGAHAVPPPSAPAPLPPRPPAPPSPGRATGPQPVTPPRPPEPPRRTRLLKPVAEEAPEVELTMQLDGPPKFEAEPAIERTLELDAPNFSATEELAIERTMQLDAPPAFTPAPAADEDEPQIERTMQLDAPPAFGPTDLVSSGEELRFERTLELDAPPAFDPNGQTMPLQPLDPNAPPPPGVQAPGIDVFATTAPIARPDLAPPGPGLAPWRASDPNAETQATPRPSGLIKGRTLSDTYPDMSAELDLTGQLLGNRYKILSKLGQGGMGVVYKAEHTLMGRTVAIKVLNPELVKSDESVARFKREIMAMAQFQHPNVVRVFDAGTTDAGRFYMAMEYVEGVSVSQILAREGRLPLERFARYCAQVLLGVAMGHRRGIVHRDLKTDNVLVTCSAPGDEVVKVMDFGIAKLLGAEEKAQSQSNVFLTTERVAVGTPEYMSPEQASGGAQVDARSDLYSLGVVAYEMLTGRLPFDADSPVGFIGKHIIDPPLAFAEAAPGLALPPQVEAFVMQALEKDPEHRYPTAEAMLDALQACLPPGPAALVAAARGGEGGGGVSASQAVAGAGVAARPTPPSPAAPAGPAPGNNKLLLALIGGAGALALLLVAVIVLLVVLGRPSLEEQLAEVEPAVQQAFAAQDWDAAAAPLAALLEGLEGEELATVEARLKRVEQAREAARRYGDNRAALQDALGRLSAHQQGGRLADAEQALLELKRLAELEAGLIEELEGLDAAHVAAGSSPLPDLAAVGLELQTLRDLETAERLLEGENPDYAGALRRLEAVQGRAGVPAGPRARATALLARARAGEAIAEVERELDKVDPDLARIEAALERADEAVRSDAALEADLRSAVEGLRERFTARRDEVARQAAAAEVSQAVDEVRLQLAEGAFEPARAALARARERVEAAGLEDTWQLAALGEELKAKVAARAAYDLLPAADEGADAAALEAAIAARDAYLRDHPQGTDRAAVEAELATLRERLAAAAPDPRREELAAKVAAAQAKLEADDLQAALSEAEAAAQLATEAGLDAAPAQALVAEAKARLERAERAEQLEGFVRLQGDVYVAVREVSNAEYLKFCLKRSLAAKTDAEKDAVRALWPVDWEWNKSRTRKMPPANQASFPVGGISFEAALAYCESLSEELGVTIRLPTEAEWTRAANGGEARVYPWGDAWSSQRVVYQRSDGPLAVAGDAIEALGGASPLGCLHMAGNVAEWTSTAWVDDEGGEDPSARVIKGGSYRSFSPQALEIAARLRGGVTEAKPEWGLRVVADLAP